MRDRFVRVGEPAAQTPDTDVSALAVEFPKALSNHCLEGRCDPIGWFPVGFQHGGNDLPRFVMVVINYVMLLGFW